MKRTFAIVLVFAMVLSLCGCGRTSLSNHKGMEYVCDPKVIVPSVEASADLVFLPEGKAVIDYSDNLIYEADGVKTIICKDVSTVCWDGTSVLYFCKTDRTLYAWQNGSSQVVFTLEDQNMRVHAIYGTKSGIVFWTGRVREFMRYTYADQKFTPAQCDININEEAFIYEDWLISVWGNYMNVTAYNLVTNEMRILDIQKTGPMDDIRDTSVQFASYDGRLFLSLRLYYGTAWVEGVTVEGVYEIDLKTMETKVLHDKYFEELYCTKLGLYAKGKFRTIELCRFD